MKNAIRKTGLSVALSLGLLAGGAAAQNTAPAPSSSAPAPAASKTRAERRADRLEQQITTMHTQLQITDAQSKQWNAYTQVMRDNARKAAEAFQERAQKMPTMNADDVMKSYAKLAQMHADDMQQLSSAWSDLYAVLSPEQRKTADTLFQNKALKPRREGARKKGSKPAPASTTAQPAGT